MAFGGLPLRIGGGRAASGATPRRDYKESFKILQKIVAQIETLRLKRIKYQSKINC